MAYYPKARRRSAPMALILSDRTADKLAQEHRVQFTRSLADFCCAHFTKATPTKSLDWPGFVARCVDEALRLGVSRGADVAAYTVVAAQFIDPESASHPSWFREIAGAPDLLPEAKIARLTLTARRLEEEQPR